MLAVALLAFVAPPEFTRTEDVIYGRKHGLALTLDVFAPAKPNGRGVLAVVSGGWFSSKSAVNPRLYAPLLARGYTVFAVLHSSQPKFTLPEVVDDLHRAVRFVKQTAGRYGVAADRLGVTGASAGGHLALMMGTAGRAGDPKAADPADRQPSGVAAVACFYPPTDFLNWGEPGRVFLGRGVYLPAFEFWERDRATFALSLVTDEAKRQAIGKQMSPITHASAKSAPTLIMHGDADELVPLQQGEAMVAKLKAAGVPAELAVKPGAGHGWPDMAKDVERFADWFDRHLRDEKPAHTADGPEQVRRAVAAGAAVLVDVREADEWAAGHLRGAVHLPLSRLKTGLPPGELDRLLPAGKPVYLHCAAGGRCRTAAQVLGPLAGGRELKPLKPGYQALVEAGFEVAR